MNDLPRPARPGGMTELEERLLAASVHRRLFSRPAEIVTIGRYRVLGRLGQGGMGVVFSAHDDQLDRRVAIKLLHAGRGQVGGEAHARLRREALALGRLSHPNVVGVYEIGEAAGQLFVAMELVEGVTLQAWLGERPRGAAEIVAAYAQAGQGLAAAHAGGLVHRDFKPDTGLASQALENSRVSRLRVGCVPSLYQAQEPVKGQEETALVPRPAPTDLGLPGTLRGDLSRR